MVESSALKSKVRGFVEIAVERINYLLRVVRENKKYLDVHHIISIIAYMLNHTPYGNSKLTPYNIMFLSVKNLDGNIRQPGEYLFDYKLKVNSDLEEKLKSYHKEFLNMVKECRNRIIKEKQKIILKKNKNRFDHKFKINDYVIIKLNDSGYGAKYRPIFGTILYKVIKTKKYVLLLESTVSNQIITRHIADVKLINFEKIAELNLPNYIAEMFGGINLSNLSNIFDIPNMESKRSRIKAKIKETEEKFDNIESESDEEIFIQKDEKDNLSDIQEEPYLEALDETL